MSDSAADEDRVYDADDVLAPVARLAAAELPLASGLAAYSREVPSWRMRLALRRMSRDIDGGRTLGEVLDRQDWLVPKYLRGMIRAGVRTGRLGQVMEEHLLCVRRTRAARTEPSWRSPSAAPHAQECLMWSCA